MNSLSRPVVAQFEAFNPPTEKQKKYLTVAKPLPDTSCLDNVGKSQKNRQQRLLELTRLTDTQSLLPDDAHNVAFRVKQYANELVVDTVPKKPVTPPPVKTGVRGKRKVRGVSPSGRRTILRCVNGLIKKRPSSHCVMMTLTTSYELSDKAFKRYVDNWLHSARKAAPEVFKRYVLGFELQQRGVMHCHILLFDIIPYEAFLRLRNLWCVKYGLGEGGVDIKPKYLDNSRAAAYYVSKIAYYVSKDGTDGKGKRAIFEGNAYSMSSVMYSYGSPIREFFVSYGTSSVFRLMDNTLYSNGWSAVFFISEDESTELLKHYGIAPPEPLRAAEKALQA